MAGLIVIPGLFTLSGDPCKRLGGSQTIQIINEVNKKPTTPKNPASAIRSKETEVINKELRKIMQQLCDTLLLENYEDANKINAMKTFLARSDPIIKRDITCELIGKTDPNVLLLGFLNDTKL